MGHLGAKQSLKRLRERLDCFPVGAPETQAVYDVLSTLFTPDEADLACRMPLRLATAAELSRALGEPEDALRRQLEGMAGKGLIFDFPLDGDEMHYMLAPTMVGIYEFSMMRVRKDIDQKALAGHLHDAVLGSEAFAQSIVGLSAVPLRVLPHETSLPAPGTAPMGTFTEILDYERATQAVESAHAWSISMCYCRHVQHHRDQDCEKIDLSSCMSLNRGAEWAIRHGFAREASRGEALELLDRARDAGLVHALDNVQNEPNYMCSCCGCCCELLCAVKRYQPMDSPIASDWIAQIEAASCTGCGKCAKACPMDAIEVTEQPHAVRGRTYKKLARIDAPRCVGCGVCHGACKLDAITMHARPERAITPKTTFERMLLGALETGKLHNFLADPARGFGWQSANALLGAFMNLPLTRRALLNQTVKSRFIDALAAGAQRVRMPGSEL